jgi:hypothetical protein
MKKVDRVNKRTMNSAKKELCMKRVLFVFAMICVLGSLVALESAPSEVVGYVKYELNNNGTSGYNIVSVPLGSQYVGTCDALFAAIPNCDVLSKWDPVTQLWVAYDGMPWTPTFTIESGYAYMAHVTGVGEWYCAGDVPDAPTFALNFNGTSGYNMIMLPLDMSNMATSDQLFADIPNCDVLSKWDSISQLWVAYDGFPWTPAWATEIGTGYMVHVTGNGTWPVVGGDSDSEKQAKKKQ